MIPEHRLADLFDQVKNSQVLDCMYHNQYTPPSLYTDHQCPRSDLPLECTAVFSEHTDEVLFVTFSNAGLLLATAGKDRTIRLYNTSSQLHVRSLTGHRDLVAYLAFSPDDMKLLSCSTDREARIWDMSVSDKSDSEDQL